ncbi:hypothetical protein V6N12_008062 [Hibiscus sabdariffa]|uniref:CCHC-type domain-containing protein n=1 Tax=Hibiscus sabdariffa TaxID=183260 RepID=A0ABR2BT69_9ROSI
MENPKLPACDSIGVAADSRSALLSSTVNGRPPDALPLVCSGPALERPGSPLADDIQRDIKKLRGPKTAILADSSAPMEFDESHSGKEGPVEVVDLSPEHGRDSGVTSGKSRVSYASVVGRSLKGDEQVQDGVVLDPNKVIVLDEDCVVNRDGQFPTIRFSTRNVCFKCGVYGHSQDLCSHIVLKTTDSADAEQPTNNVNAPVRPDTSAEGLFGPWMVVDTRRHRALAGKSAPKGVDAELHRANGSRFAILGKDSRLSELEQISVAEGDVQQSLKNVQEHLTSGSLAPRKGVAAKAVVMPMVEGRTVSVVEHAGHGASHSAVSIVEQGHGGRSGDPIVQGKRMRGKAKGVKENVKQGLKIRKSSDVRTISRPVLSEWVDNMNTQLDNFARDRELEPGGVVRVLVNQEGVLEKTTSLEDRNKGQPGLSTDVSEDSDRRMDLSF